MVEKVIIQREPSGFTLHFPGKGRLEVDHTLLSEEQALVLFAEHHGLQAPEMISVDSFNSDILLEGIDSVTVKRGEDIQSYSLETLFAGAIDIMIREANEQELVNRYLPILNQGGFALESFKMFFYLLLKQTKEKPMQYVFPEFSIANPITTGSVDIGGAYARHWGIIRDIDNLKAIYDSIHNAIQKEIGEAPHCVSVDNYYLSH